MPAIHPQCAVALRATFQPGDEGTRKLSLNFINADGRSILQGIELPVPVTLPDDAHFLTRNFIVNIQQLKFDEPGLYSVDVRLDDESVASVPLLVRQVAARSVAGSSGLHFQPGQFSTMNEPILKLDLPGIKKVRSGKVREVFDLGDRFLLVASDRISAFDVIMPNGIPRKGEVLTQISHFWFEQFSALVPNHLLARADDPLPNKSPAVRRASSRAAP